MSDKNKLALRNVDADMIDKGLEACTNGGGCRNCPYWQYSGNCVNVLMKDAQAHIYQLKKRRGNARHDGGLTMALMHDMETVNKTMQTAASFVASGGTEREKYILNTFAAMKPVEVKMEKHAQWVPIYTGYRCSACLRFTKKGKHARCKCGAIMDGRAEE